MSKYWSEQIRRLTPYVPGEQPQSGVAVKLNTNENPYGPSPKVVEAIRQATNETLRLYPDPEASKLRQALADFRGVKAGQVFVGNGSDEVLAHVFATFFSGKAPICFAEITYSFYPVYCHLYGIEYRTVALDERLRISAADYLAPSGGVVLASPNAPTGQLLDYAEIKRIAQADQTRVLVVDEAYVDFGGESVATQIEHHDNLLVVQTLSKSHSLAGLRVGFAIGAQALIEGLQRRKNSFNSYPVDRLAQVGAVAALKDRAHFEATRQRIMQTRARAASKLAELGFEVLPSAANFLLVRHPARNAFRLMQGLRRQAILVRHFNHEQIRDYLRITIGTPEQIEQLLVAIESAG